MMIKDIKNNSTPKSWDNLLPLSSPSQLGVTLGDDKMTKYKLTTVNHDGTEIEQITTHDDIIWLTTYARCYKNDIDLLFGEFWEKVDWKNGDTIELYIEPNDDVIRDVDPFIIATNTLNGVEWHEYPDFQKSWEV